MNRGFGAGFWVGFEGPFILRRAQDERLSPFVVSLSNHERTTPSIRSTSGLTSFNNI
jgi:hypothetical protein